MQQKMTKDNSITFFNEQYQEHYHSTSGAREESIKKFVEPCIPYLEGKDEIIILDVCFGIGYNTAAAIDTLSNYCKKIIVYCLENDKEILNKILSIDANFESYNIIKKLVMNDNYELQTTFNNCKLTIKILLGDARETIKDINNVDAVLFDPFSPKKCPELWTREFFLEVKKSMNNGGVLTTYSCAKTVRDTMRELGYKVLNGPCVGRKAPSTVAVN